LDPIALFAGPKEIEAAAAAVLNSFGVPQGADGTWHGHVFNLGHGISQYTPPENVEILVNFVRANSRIMRR
jgi:uroporphyrinogen decarboxylase